MIYVFLLEEWVTDEAQHELRSGVRAFGDPVAAVEAAREIARGVPASDEHGAWYAQWPIGAVVAAIALRDGSLRLTVTALPLDATRPKGGS